ncbi:MAG: S41 family peptidase [Rubrivivax sp.]
MALISCESRARVALPAVARAAAAGCLALLLSACGGGGGDGGAGSPGGQSQSCSATDQKRWLADYMDEWYFWYRISPRPEPGPYADADAYLRALLYTGSDARFPADRYSGSQTTASFNRLFGDGETLGYGMSVAGLEVLGDPSQPLIVRLVEPQSPAATQGVQRGDRVVSINGRPAADVIAANDFSALSANEVGETLSLQLRRDGIERTVVLRSAVFALTPVSGTAVFRTAGGRQMGYLSVKDMITQSLQPSDAAFAQFRAASVADLVLDLRYNGGGLVSAAATLASYAAGQRGAGQTFANLLYNDKRAAANNQRYAFEDKGNALGLPRVYVLMGRRTCSASEQVINGLRGIGIEVVAIGEATCGKPVGFLPTANCGRTWSIVNFESVNQRNEGRYFDGFAPVCAVAEDFNVEQAGAADPLLRAARHHADTGTCPAASVSMRATAARRGSDGLRARPAFVGEEGAGQVLR